MTIVIEIDENLYTRLFDNGVDNYDDAVDMAKAIRKGTPLPEHHENLVETKCVGKCFICGKEIQRDSILRIEEPKIDKIILGKDKEEHLVCDTCGNLLTIMYKMLNDGTSEF